MQFLARGLRQRHCSAALAAQRHKRLLATQASQLPSPEAHSLLLDARVPPVPSISPALRVVTFLVGHTACGDTAGVADDWRHLMSSPATRALAYEAVLQTHLFIGVPRTLNAFAAIAQLEDSLGGPWEACGSTEPLPEPAVGWRRAGEEALQAVYGGQYERLRRNMRRLSPDLDAFIVEHGYGRVLARPGMTMRERELCVVAALAGQNVAPQLYSHIRGALLVGGTKEEVAGVLAQTGLVWGRPEAQEEVDAVWATFERARYSL
eukprot:tig00001095_g7044.t1